MLRLPSLRVFLIAGAVIAGIACGKSMPTAPTASSVTTAPLSSAATISGSVAGGGSGQLSSLSTAGTAPSGLVVSVTGTTISGAVDAAGRFRLVNVPAGSVELRIVGPGVDVRVPVGTVNAGDTLEIRVTVNGNSGGIEDSDHSHDGEREIEGRVTAIPPQTGAGQFVVAGITVTTDSATTFKTSGHTGRFTDIIVGARVHVKATASLTGTGVVAREVNVQSQNLVPPGPGGPDDDDDDDADDDPKTAEVSGAVTGLSGACPALTFTVRNTKVTTTAATRFDLACTAIRASVKVEVEGTRGTDGSITATRVKKD